ncbi:MAG TPA: GNAT family N-acetyltransferase [Anaerolineaceae bacterium]|nr:GNAT family N-acetyltransferase [Anaerolineaceae bacterium]
MDQRPDHGFGVDRESLSYQIRPALGDEAAAIRRLIHAVHINPISLDWRRFIVAVDKDGILLGCGQIKPHKDGSRELASIAVEAEFRGRGIATAIIHTLLLEHSSPLYLTCRASLGSFYERFGFQRVPAQAMPPYFRHLRNLIQFARRFRNWEEILVMIRS